METVQPNGTFSFDRVIAGLRRLLDAGYTPFLEISHMPDTLAASLDSDSQTGAGALATTEDNRLLIVGCGTRNCPSGGNCHTIGQS